MKDERPSSIAGGRKQLRAEVEHLEERLARLAEERASTKERLAALRAALGSHPMADAPPRQGQSAPEATPAPQSPAAKVALFRSLFTGRTDVFPTEWHSAKTGRKGYSPACDNEWVRSVCDKPRIKCAECPNQAFTPVTAQVIRDHLTGRHIAGLYPLIEGDTCHLLAVDFDKGSWEDDVRAFAETCRSHSLPVAVERSRSGEGAHAWFFFSDRVPAASARKMGCYLITETMGRRHQLSISSYDRLFPNQDTLPSGGFGNLIALPLQHAARRAGNTVFVDESMRPFHDQWAYLAQVERISPQRVREMGRDAARAGNVIGVGSIDVEESRQPWLERLQHPSRPIEGRLPSSVNLVLREQLFVEKKALSPGLISRIKRLAAFENPEFYKKQALRLSVALTPRVISCAQDHPHHIELPRGCVGAVTALLGSCGVEPVVDDQRCDGDALPLMFHGELAQHQKKAAEAMLAHEMGVFVAPPGTGKTVVGTYLIAERGVNSLALVNRTPLLDQWRAQLALFLDLGPAEVGQIGGGRRKPTGRLDVAMIQSLARREDLNDAVAHYGHVLVDECHHLPAPSFERVLRAAPARYVTGLTATPERRDGHHPIHGYHLGPVRHSIDPRSEAARRRFEHRLIVRETEFHYVVEGNPKIQEIYSCIATDSARNELILDDVVSALEEGRSPVLLSERREHVDYFAERLTGVARNLVVLRGGMGVKQRRQVAEKLADIADDEERLLLATGRFIGEGFDDARLDSLFLAMPVSWRGTLSQYAGRLHRAHQRKKEVRIYDYLDCGVPMLARMFEKRLRGYRSMGYELRALPEAARRAEDDYVIEYDEAALRALEYDDF